MPTHLCGCMKEAVGNVDKDHVVLIFIFLLYMSVKANSFQERLVLTLSAALAVIVDFLLAVSRLPFCFCYNTTLAQSIPSRGAVPQGSPFLLELYAVCCPDDFMGRDLAHGRFVRPNTRA